MEHAKKSMTIGGKQWGIPYTYYQWGVYYRKDLFTANGISVPKTWDDFVAACATLKAAGITPIKSDQSIFGQQLVFLII